MIYLGQTHSNYTFVEYLGSGSFSSVYKVEKNGAFYAAKVFNEDYFLEQYKGSQNRITNEINALMIANHPSLIRYIDDFMINNEYGSNQYILITEFFDGITLSKKMNDPNISSLDKLDIFKNILNGIKELHGFGIFHRDLKPDNILVNHDKQVKIIDYGLSKLINFSSITSSGAILGSPMFLSPEQAIDSKKIDHRSDIYSLGVILYWITTNGNYPYAGNGIPELIYNILNTPITPPSQYNKNIKQYIEKVIYKALNKSMYKRYLSINEFIDALEVESINIPKLIVKPMFYAWFHNEVKILNQFICEKHNDLTLIYPIHSKKASKQVYEKIRRKEIQAIIDPSTHRLSYSTFSSKPSLTELAYAPNNKIITLNDLNNLGFRQSYIENWWNEIRFFDHIILPYHYISNTNYGSVSDLEGWIKANVLLAQESIDYLYKKEDSSKKFVMITLDINHLVHQAEKILNYYTKVDVDGYIVLISGLDKANITNYNSAISFLIDLQQSTDKNVIFLKAPVALGLYALSKGIHGYSVGISDIETFNEDYIKNDSEKSNLYFKFYFPELISLVTGARDTGFPVSEIYNKYFTCDCSYCTGNSFINILSKKNEGFKPHFLERIQGEIKIISNIDNINSRLLYYKNRINYAIKNYDQMIKLDVLKDSDSNYNRLLVIKKLLED